MVSVGCSITWGEGMPQHALFHEKFAERLRRETGKTVINWNLAECGAGCDLVERVLHIAVPILDPHIVLVLFPEVARREHLSPDGNYHPYVPRHLLDHPRLKWVADDILKLAGQHNQAIKAIWDALGGIASEQDDELRFFRSYKSIEALLSNRCWLMGFTATEIECFHVFRHVDSDLYIGYCRQLDWARDDIHPGPATHDALFRGFWNTFELIGGMRSVAGATS
jgi:hypothetical protein